VNLKRDTCPEGDLSPSYYDKECGTNDTTDNAGTGLLVVSTGHDTLSEDDMSNETEVVSAYQWAFTNGITTLQPLEKADPQ
jgi:hypothetical protein